VPDFSPNINFVLGSVGTNYGLFGSVDGLNFNKITTLPSQSSKCAAVAKRGNAILAMFMGTNLLYISENYGRTWRSYSMPASNYSNAWGTIVWSGDRWVIAMTRGYVIQTTDLINFTATSIGS